MDGQISWCMRCADSFYPLTMSLGEGFALSTPNSGFLLLSLKGIHMINIVISLFPLSLSI
jgi:hypothetical protein